MIGRKGVMRSTIRTTGNIYTPTDNTAREATELLAREIVGDCGRNERQNSIDI
jgi:hypothetical protein